MAEFIIRTSDNVYSYNSLESEECKTVNVTFEIENNNVKSDTQGFLRKVQIGEKRIKAVVTLVDSKVRIENNLYPMLTYADDVVCTFDRNIPLRYSNSGIFVIEDIKILQELPDEVHEISIELTEVI